MTQVRPQDTVEAYAGWIAVIRDDHGQVKQVLADLIHVNRVIDRGIPEQV